MIAQKNFEEISQTIDVKPQKNDFFLWLGHYSQTSIRFSLKTAVKMFALMFKTNANVDFHCW